MLCCCGADGVVSPEPQLDRVEMAFRRMDRNKDGFITWDEFIKVSMKEAILFSMFILFTECWAPLT